MTEEQQKRRWVTIWVCVALAALWAFFLEGFEAFTDPGILVWLGFAAFGGWWIGLIVTGADLFVGDYHRMVNRNRPDDDPE